MTGFQLKQNYIIIAYPFFYFFFKQLPFLQKMHVFNSKCLFIFSMCLCLLLISCQKAYIVFIPWQLNDYHFPIFRFCFDFFFVFLLLAHSFIWLLCVWCLLKDLCIRKSGAVLDNYMLRLDIIIIIMSITISNYKWKTQK